MSYVVTLKYDPIWKALEWAKKNCKSYITNIAGGRGHNDTWENYQVNYYFGSEKEALLFKIAWADQIVERYRCKEKKIKNK